MDDIITGAESRMKKTISILEEDYQTLRAGRANPKLLDKITVNYYGTETPLNQLANISTPDARTLLISLYDNSILKAAEKAILASDIGINPSNDGKSIRLVVPELYEDRRKELVKTVRQKGEEAKVAVRNTRRDVVDKIKKQKKDGLITEDDQKNDEDKVQKLTDKYIKEIDGVVAAKEKEIMQL